MWCDAWEIHVKASALVRGRDEVIRCARADAAGGKCGRVPTHVCGVQDKQQFIGAAQSVAVQAELHHDEAGALHVGGNLDARGQPEEVALVACVVLRLVGQDIAAARRQ